MLRALLAAAALARGARAQYSSSVTTFAGSGANAVVDGVGRNASFSSDLRHITIAANGMAYVTEKIRIRSITPAGGVRVFAGNAGFMGGSADGTGTNAFFNSPTGVVVAPSGMVYVASNGKIRVMTPAGFVTSFAGNGADSYGDGIGTSAFFDIPQGISISLGGTIYVADSENHRIRAVSPTGTVTTLAGSGAFAFADGVGGNAAFNDPRDVTVSKEGVVYVTDCNNYRIRAISPGGVVTTLAGSGTPAVSAADGVGTNAAFGATRGIVISPSNIIYVADFSGSRIRSITLAGVVGTIAGSGSPGFLDGPGLNAQLNSPFGLALYNGTLYVVDSLNYRIRAINISAFPCPAKAYCPPGGAGPYPCPAGSYCPPLSITPTPCAAGSYSPVPSRATCILCPAGSWTDLPGQAVCEYFCSAGTFRAFPGGNSSAACAACPAGSFSDADGATSCTQCPAGTALNVSGASAASACAPCPPSQYAPSGSSKCAACPAGSAPDAAQASCVVGGPSCADGSAAGGTGPCREGFFCPPGAPNATANPCPPSTTSPPGACAAAQCAPCAAGFFCPGASPAVPCAAGSYAPVTGRASCILCNPGSFTSSPGATVCDSFCPEGTARAQPGAARLSDCVACAPGSFAAFVGSSACTPCPAGRALPTSGATSAALCVRCAAAQYAPAGSATCATCPAGSAPDPATQSTCIAGAFACADGTMLAAPGATTCVPLACPAPLALPTAPPLTACVACAANTTGAPAYPDCAPCASGLCPGTTAAPLVSFAGAPSAARAAACPPLAGALALAPLFPPARAARPGFSWLTGVITADEMILTGICFAAAALAALAAAHALAAVPSDAARGAAAALAAALARADVFTAADRVVDGRFARSKRAVGGAFTLLGLVAFATLALTLILQRAADNVAANASVLLLSGPSAAGALALPVFGDTGRWGSGIQVRVTASCDAGAGAGGAAWSATEPAAWSLAPPAPCGAPGVAQLVFRCADCRDLTASSSLSLALHHSCQSLLVEAAALDAAGGVSAFATVAAAPPGALLSSIAWTLPTLLAVVNSSVPTAASARGFTLTALPAAVKSAPLAPAPGGAPGGAPGALVAPAAAAVSLTLSFALQTFYTQTTLTPRQTVVQLLSSIIGVAGIFGLFGTLLGLLDAAGAVARRLTARRDAQKAALVAAPAAGAARGAAGGEGGARIAAPAAGAARGAAGGEGEARVNPLRTEGAPGGKPAETADGPDGWVSVTDGAQSWYRGPAGEVAWVLPDGARLRA